MLRESPINAKLGVGSPRILHKTGQPAHPPASQPTPKADDNVNECLWEDRTTHVATKKFQTEFLQAHYRFNTNYTNPANCWATDWWPIWIWPLLMGLMGTDGVGWWALWMGGLMGTETTKQPLKWHTTIVAAAAAAATTTTTTVAAQRHTCRAAPGSGNKRAAAMATRPRASETLLILVYVIFVMLFLPPSSFVFYHPIIHSRALSLSTLSLSLSLSQFVEDLVHLDG